MVLHPAESLRPIPPFRLFCAASISIEAKHYAKSGPAWAVPMAAPVDFLKSRIRLSNPRDAGKYLHVAGIHGSASLP